MVGGPFDIQAERGGGFREGAHLFEDVLPGEFAVRVEPGGHVATGLDPEVGTNQGRDRGRQDPVDFGFRPDVERALGVAAACLRRAVAVGILGGEKAPGGMRQIA